MEACIGGYYCCAADLSKKLEERKEFDVVSSVDDVSIDDSMPVIVDHICQDGNTACLLAAKFAPLKFVHDFYHFYVDEEITIENKVIFPFESVEKPVKDFWSSLESLSCIGLLSEDSKKY